MKLNVEIELDWIEEDNSVDEQVKQEIISNIEGRISAELKKTIMDRAEKQIEQAVMSVCFSEIQKRIKTLIDTPRTVTDEYGRVLQEGFTLEGKLIDMIEQSTVTKTRTSDGKHAQKGGYDRAEYTEIEWFAKKLISENINKKLETAVEDTKKHIEQLIKDKIKTEVADKLTALIIDNSSALSLKRPD